MATPDPKVDAYIEKAEGFAKPILIHLRSLVHKARPDVTEAMKWSMPFFTHTWQKLGQYGSIQRACRCLVFGKV